MFFPILKLKPASAANRTGTATSKRSGSSGYPADSQKIAKCLSSNASLGHLTACDGCALIGQQVPDVAG
jgi:hypothetical protein